MELAGNVAGYAHTGSGGARIRSSGAGLGVRDLRAAFIRVGVTEGNIRD